MNRLAGVNAMAKSREQHIGRCYLAVGAFLCLIAVIVKPGVYTGSLRGQINFETDEASASVSLAAETEPEWCWACPRNYRYQQATLTIIDESKRTVQLDLAKGAWACGDEKGQLDAGELSRLIAGRRSGTATSDAAMLQHEQYLLNTLQQLRDGAFFRPRHHSYYVQNPLRASFQHFTSGLNCGLFAVAAWLLAWPVCLVFFRQPSTSRWLTPARAFFITGGIVVLLDLLFIGVHALFSPGVISEVMEFMIALLNMPAWIILDGGSGRTWLGLVFGAVSWSVLISVGTIFTKPAQRRPATSDTPADNQPPSF
jgi:hypothetical protein